MYPTGDEPTRGVFVRARLEALARTLPVRVVAPVPWVRWGAGTRRRCWRRPSLPAPPDAAQVLRPQWWQLPGDSPMNGPLLAMQLLPLLLREWKRSPWEVIDAHFAVPEGLAAALLAGVTRSRFTITLRGRELEQANHVWMRRVLSWALRRADRVFAVSSELQLLSWRLGVPAERTRLVPNGVDPALFHPLGRDLVRAELGIDPQTQLLLVVARIHPVKGILELLDCLPRLMEEFPRLNVHLVGDVGRGAAAYARQVRERVGTPALRGRVHLVGPLAQSLLVRWMNAADLLCLPSRREGCPNVVLEALACRLPVLATAVGAVPDLLSDSRQGMVIPPHDRQALEDGLRCCLRRNWPARHTGVAGIRSWDQVAGELVDSFRSLSSSCIA